MIFLTEWARMFIITFHTPEAFMILPTVTFGHTKTQLSLTLNLLYRIHLRKSMSGWLRSDPQLPVHRAPRISFGLFLAEISKVLIIVTSVISSCCQIPYDFTVFHQQRSFYRIFLCVDTHENLIGCDPHFY